MNSIFFIFHSTHQNVDDKKGLETLLTLWGNLKFLGIVLKKFNSSFKKTLGYFEGNNKT